jgi:arylsulfatase A
VDGVDVWPMLSGEREHVDRDILLFFDGWNVQCVRWGPWKLHLARYNSYAWTSDPPGGRWNLPLKNPELYHVDDDPGENYDCAPEKKQLVNDLKERFDRLMLSMPQQVRAAWQETLSQRVYDTPTGALPGREQ